MLHPDPVSSSLDCQKFNFQTFILASIQTNNPYEVDYYPKSPFFGLPRVSLAAKVLDYHQLHHTDFYWTQKRFDRWFYFEQARFENGLTSIRCLWEICGVLCFIWAPIVRKLQKMPELATSLHRSNQILWAFFLTKNLHRLSKCHHCPAITLILLELDLKFDQDFGLENFLIWSRGPHFSLSFDKVFSDLDLDLQQY